MRYNIEFQIAGFIVTLIIAIATFTRRHEITAQGKIFRFLIIATLIELAMDITSVITIVHRVDIPEINDVFSVGYLLSVVIYIALMVIYGIFSDYSQDMTKTQKICFYTECGILYVATIITLFSIFTHELKYAGQERSVYSYGIPSDAVYTYSTFAVIFLILITLLNIRSVPLKRQVPICTFCLMEGTVAIIQMLNKELLIIGFGTAITIFIMYLVLENPDLKLISYLTELNHKSRDLVMNIIPSTSISSRNHMSSSLNSVSDISIFYLIIRNSTELTLQMGEEKLVSAVIDFFEELDKTIEGYRLTKLKTTGTTYMAIGGYPERTELIHEEILQFAMAAERAAREYNKIHNIEFILSIGIHIGDAVIRVTTPGNIVYDIWGESIYKTMVVQNAAPEGKICVSDKVYEKLNDRYKFLMGSKVNASEIQIQTWILDF